MITVCGVFCEKECKAYKKNCHGCNQIKGKVTWAKFLDKDTCPIFQCVQNKGYKTCYDCENLPCNIWLKETKNPDMSDKEYKEDIKHRIKNLNQIYLDKK